jgi:hypothetical protein
MRMTLKAGRVANHWAIPEIHGGDDQRTLADADKVGRHARRSPERGDEPPRLPKILTKLIRIFLFAGR